MQFIDLQAQYAAIEDRVLARIQNVLRHGGFIMGPEIRELERKLAEFAGVRYAVACSSGTDALLMPLMAYGVGPGDAVFTTPFTFVATAEVIALRGATPVFVDVDPETFNIDSEKLQQVVRATAQAGELKPKGVIAVDLFGLPADYDSVSDVAKAHELFLIEDAAQSFGAGYKGRIAGGLGDVAATSFFPAKPLGGYGDGGAALTDNEELAAVLESIRVHGQSDDKYDNVRIGLNARLDTLQAAVLLEKLEIFPREIELREQAAQAYAQKLDGCVRVPRVPEGYRSVWAQYSVLSPARDAIQSALQAMNIPTAIYYRKPLHLQRAFAYLGHRPGDFPVAEDLSERIFSLPMHPYLQPEDIEAVTACIHSACEKI